MLTDERQMEIDRQGIDLDQWEDASAQRLSLTMLSTSGALTAGVITSFLFSGWVVAIATLFGGVVRLSVSALCWVARD